MHTLRFEVTICPETGGYVARWDDPQGGGITTQGDNFAELDAMVRDAVEGYFADGARPAELRLHFVDDPVLSITRNCQMLKLASGEQLLRLEHPPSGLCLEKRLETGAAVIAQMTRWRPVFATLLTRELLVS